MRSRYYTPILPGGAPRSRQILIVVSNETVKNACCSKMLADFIELDARASYSLLIVGGGIFSTSKNYFTPSDNGMKTGAFNIHSAIHLTVPVLYKIRAEFLNRIREDERCRKNRYAVTFWWKKPEVVFDDADGGNRYWDTVETIGVGGEEDCDAS